MKETIKKIVDKIKYPIAYATAFTLLSGGVEGGWYGGGLETAIDNIKTNAPFFAGLNTFYGTTVDFLSKKSGRFAVNTFCIATNLAFLGYVALTNDGNIQYAHTIASAAIGIPLTNIHFNLVQKEKKQKETLYDLLPDNAAFTNP